jgi:hypothetical protein
MVDNELSHDETGIKSSVPLTATMITVMSIVHYYRREAADVNYIFSFGITPIPTTTYIVATATVEHRRF